MVRDDCRKHNKAKSIYDTFDKKSSDKPIMIKTQSVVSIPLRYKSPITSQYSRSPVDARR
jgi:hypothetical protein